MKRFWLLLILLSVFLLTGCVSESEKAYRQAIELMNEGSYFQAKTGFEQLARDNFKDASEYAKQCTLEIARNNMNNKNFDTAIKSLLSLCDGGYRPAEEVLLDCYMQYGKYQMANQRYESAIECFTQAEKLNPSARKEFAQCYYEYGLYMSNQGDKNKAKELLNIALQEGHNAAADRITEINRQLINDASIAISNENYEQAYAILYPLLLQEQFGEAAPLYEECAQILIQKYHREFNYSKEADIHCDRISLGYAGASEAAQEAFFYLNAYSLFGQNALEAAYDALNTKMTNEEAERQLIHWALQHVDYSVTESADGTIRYGNDSYCYGFQTDKGYMIQLKNRSTRNGQENYYWFYIGNDQHVKLIKSNIRFVRGYEATENVIPGMYVVEENDGAYRYGIVDGAGNTVIPCLYDEYLLFEEGRAIARRDGKYGVINLQGEIVIPFIYDKILAVSEGLYPAQYQGKYGYIDLEGNVALNFIYADAQPFSEGYAAVKKDYKYMYIDRQGEALCEAVWDELQPFSQGFGVVCRNGKYGYMRSDGTLDGTVEFKSASSYKDGISVFTTDSIYTIGTVYVRDLNGKVLGSAKSKDVFSDEYTMRYGGSVINHQGILLGTWSSTTSYGNGWYAVTNTVGSEGALHYKRGLVIPCQWDYVRILPDADAAIVGKGNRPARYGLISLQDGSTILDPVWYGFSVLEEGLIAYQEEYNGLWGIASADGKILTEPQWEGVGNYAEGYLAVQKNGDSGYATIEGITAGPVIWDKVTSFSEELAAVCMNDKWGYINAQGETVIPVQYSTAAPFKNGWAWVGNMYINREGVPVLEHVSNSLGDGFDQNGLAVIGYRNSSSYYEIYGHYDKQGNYYGYYNKNSFALSYTPSFEEVLERAYDENAHVIWYFSPVKLRVVDGFLHMVNNAGEILY